VLHWFDYAEVYPGHTIAGTIKVLRQLHSSQLDNHRDILVYLPHAQGGQRYPVIYFHDGQNLFDPATSYAGEWCVDETLEQFAAEGIEAIAVGIPNAGEMRMSEYSPYKHETFGAGGLGDLYLAFIRDTVKPLIDESFPTISTRESTGIMGSSMGGLISLYAFFRFPATFGFAGMMSPALMINPEIFDFVQFAPFEPGRLYVDVGTREVPEADENYAGMRAHRVTSELYLEVARRLRDLLLAKGYARDLLYIEEEGAIHHEDAWARRLPDALRFLLKR